MTGVLLEIPCTHHRWTFSLGAPLDTGFQKLRIRIVNHEIDAVSRGEDLICDNVNVLLPSTFRAYDK